MLWIPWDFLRFCQAGLIFGKTRPLLEYVFRWEGQLPPLSPRDHYIILQGQCKVLQNRILLWETPPEHRLLFFTQFYCVHCAKCWVFGFEVFLVQKKVLSAIFVHSVFSPTNSVQNKPTYIERFDFAFGRITVIK